MTSLMPDDDSHLSPLCHPDLQAVNPDSLYLPQSLPDALLLPLLLLRLLLLLLLLAGLLIPLRLLTILLLLTPHSQTARTLPQELLLRAACLNYG